METAVYEIVFPYSPKCLIPADTYFINKIFIAMQKSIDIKYIKDFEFFLPRDLNVKVKITSLSLSLLKG